MKWTMRMLAVFATVTEYVSNATEPASAPACPRRATTAKAMGYAARVTERATRLTECICELGSCRPGCEVCRGNSCVPDFLRRSGPNDKDHRREQFNRRHRERVRFK